MYVGVTQGKDSVSQRQRAFRTWVPLKKKVLLSWQQMPLDHLLPVVTVLRLAREGTRAATVGTLGAQTHDAVSGPSSFRKNTVTGRKR